METDIKKLLDEQKKEIIHEVTQQVTRDVTKEVTNAVVQQVGVLLEGVNDNIKLIAEQHTSTQERLDSIDVRLTHIEDELTQKVDYNEFDKLEKRVGILEEKSVS